MVVRGVPMVIGMPKFFDAFVMRRTIFASEDAVNKKMRRLEFFYGFSLAVEIRFIPVD